MHVQTWQTDDLFVEYFKNTEHRVHGKRTWIVGVNERQQPIVDAAWFSTGAAVMFIEPTRERYEFAMARYSGASFRNASLQSAIAAIDTGGERAPDNLYLFSPDNSRFTTFGQMEYFRVRRTRVMAEFQMGYQPEDFDPQIWGRARTPAGPEGPLFVWSLLLPRES